LSILLLPFEKFFSTKKLFCVVTILKCHIGKVGRKEKSPLPPSLPKKGTPNSSPFEKGGLRGG